MQKIDIDKFKEHCNKKICLRRTFTNDKCLTESKQDSCYIQHGVVSGQQEVRQEKYREDFRQKQINRFKNQPAEFPKSGSLTRDRIVKERKERTERLKEHSNKLNERQKDNNKKWQEVKTALFIRDKECRVWQCLTQNERALVLASFVDQMMMFRGMDDAAHILPRSTHPELCYELDNLLRINRYFHTLLDTYRNPISQSPMSKEEHDMWFRRIKNFGKEPTEEQVDLN